MSLGTIITYARKTLETFENLPFNDVDAAILAQLSYAQLDGYDVPQLADTRQLLNTRIMEAEQERQTWQYKLSHLFSHEEPRKITLSDDERFVSLYDALWHAESYTSIFPSEASRAQMIELVGDLIASPRFRDIRVGEFTYEYHEERYNDKQFAAMTFLLPDGTEFISFRGTEATLIGWREDFELAFNKVIPSQISAVEYITEVSSHSNGRPLMIAGHSKGGNTAVYAASMIEPELQNTVTAVYSFDGPGFITNLLETDGYKAIEPKLVKLVPQDSFVGLMFKGREPYRVAHSNASSFNQHFLFTWVVDDSTHDFVHDSTVTKNALNIADSYVQWTDSLDMETRRRVIDSMFKVFEATGYSTFTEIAENITTAAPVMWDAVNSASAQGRGIVLDSFRDLFSRIFGFNRSVFQFEGINLMQLWPFGGHSEHEDHAEHNDAFGSEEQRSEWGHDERNQF